MLVRYELSIYCDSILTKSSCLLVPRSFSLLFITNPADLSVCWLLSLPIPLSHNIIEYKSCKISVHIWRIYMRNWYITLSTQKMWNDLHHLHAVSFCVHINFSYFYRHFHMFCMYTCLCHYNLYVVLVISCIMKLSITVLTSPFLKTC